MALKKPNNKTTIFIHTNNTLIKTQVFFKLQMFLAQKVYLTKNYVYIQIIPKLVKKSLFYKSTNKALGSNKFNFKLIKRF